MKYNKFAAVLPENKYFKKALIETLMDKYPWVSVAGLDSPYSTTSGRTIKGVQYAGAGDAITFGTAKSHDVNWTNDLNWFNQGEYKPIYDLAKDYNKVMDNLAEFAEARKPKPVHQSCNCIICGKLIKPSYNKIYVDGKEVEIYDNFIKIGYNLFPRYTKPEVFSTYTTIELRKIATIVVSIKSLF